MDVPVLVDRSVAPLACKIATNAGGELRRSLHDATFQAWQALQLPDFGGMELG